MTVRPEAPADADAVRRVTEAAFGQPDEAAIVDRLRERGVGYRAWVAEVRGEVVGHVAFSAVTVEGAPGLRAVGLAPMAVAPERQRTGIGEALVWAGLAGCRADGVRAVVVLGHPGYYPRFGFAPARAFGLRDAYGAPPEAFMALELAPGALDGVVGTVHYDPALAG